MNNYYKPAATSWAKEQGLTLRRWLTGWGFEDALRTVRYGSPHTPDHNEEDAAMWLWYMAARKAGGRLTFNVAEMPGDVMDWKRAARMAPNLIHPDVYSICHPYQLVIG